LSYENVEPDERAMSGVPFGRRAEVVMEGEGCFRLVDEERREETLRGE
jgi:hypothetical protein